MPVKLCTCVSVGQFGHYDPAGFMILQGGPLVLGESSANENCFYSKERFVTSRETVRCNKLHFIFLAI